MELIGLSALGELAGLKGNFRVCEFVLFIRSWRSVSFLVAGGLLSVTMGYCKKEAMRRFDRYA